MQKEIFIIDPAYSELSPEESMYILEPLYGLLQTIQTQLDLDMYDLSIQKITSYELDEGVGEPLINPILAPKCLDSIQNRRLLHLKIKEDIMNVDGLFDRQRAWAKAVAFFPLAFCSYKNTDSYKEIKLTYLRSNQDTDRQLAKDELFNKLWAGFTALLNLAIDKAERYESVELDKKQESLLSVFNSLINDVTSDFDFERYVNPLIINRTEFPIPKSLSQINDMRAELFSIDIFKDANMSLLEPEEIEALTPLEVESYEYIRNIDPNPDTFPKAKLLSFIRHLYQIDKKQANGYAEGYEKMYTRKNPGGDNKPKQKTLNLEGFKEIRPGSLDVGGIALSETRKAAQTSKDETFYPQAKLITDFVIEVVTMRSQGYGFTKKDDGLVASDKPEHASYSKIISTHYDIIFDKLVKLENLNISDVFTRLIIYVLAKKETRMSKEDIIEQTRKALLAYQSDAKLAEKTGIQKGGRGEILLFEVLVNKGFPILDTLSKVEYTKDFDSKTRMVDSFIGEDGNLSYSLSPEMQENILIEAISESAAILSKKIRITDRVRAVQRFRTEQREILTQKEIEYASRNNLSFTMDQIKDRIKSELATLVENYDLQVARQVQDEEVRKKELIAEQEKILNTFISTPDIKKVIDVLTKFRKLNLASNILPKKVKRISSDYHSIGFGGILFGHDRYEVPADVQITDASSYVSNVHPSATKKSTSILRPSLINFINEPVILYILNAIVALHTDGKPATRANILKHDPNKWDTTVAMAKYPEAINKVFVYNNNIKDLLSDIISLLRDVRVITAKNMEVDQLAKMVEVFSMDTEYKDKIKDIVTEVATLNNANRRHKIYERLLTKDRIKKILTTLNLQRFSSVGASTKDISNITNIDEADIKFVIYLLVATGYVSIKSNVSSLEINSELTSSFVLTQQGADLVKDDETRTGKFRQFYQNPEIMDPVNIDILSSLDKMLWHEAKSRVHTRLTNNITPGFLSHEVRTALYEDAKLEVLQNDKTINEIAGKEGVELTEAFSMKDMKGLSSAQRKYVQDLLQKLNKKTKTKVDEKIDELNSSGKMEDYINAVKEQYLNTLFQSPEVKISIDTEYYREKSSTYSSHLYQERIIDKIFSQNGEGIENINTIGSAINTDMVSIVFDGLKLCSQIPTKVIERLDAYGLTPASIYEAYTKNNKELPAVVSLHNYLKSVIVSRLKDDKDRFDVTLFLKLKKQCLMFLEENGPSTYETTESTEETTESTKETINIDRLITSVCRIIDDTRLDLFSGSTETNTTRQNIAIYCRRQMIDELCDEYNITFETLVFILVANGIVAHKNYDKTIKYPFGLNVVDIQKQTKRFETELKTVKWSEEDLTINVNEIKQGLARIKGYYARIDDDVTKAGKRKDVFSEDRRRLIGIKTNIELGLNPDGKVNKDYRSEKNNSLVSINDKIANLDAQKKEFEKQLSELEKMVGTSEDISPEGTQNLISGLKNKIAEIDQNIPILAVEKAGIEEKIAPYIEENANAMTELQASFESETLRSHTNREIAQLNTKANEIWKNIVPKSNLLATYNREQSKDMTLYNSKDAVLYTILALSHAGYVEIVTSAIGDLGKASMYFKLTQKGLDFWNLPKARAAKAKEVLTALKAKPRKLETIADQIKDILIKERQSKLLTIQQRKEFRDMLGEIVSNVSKSSGSEKQTYSKKTGKPTDTANQSGGSDSLKVGDVVSMKFPVRKRPVLKKGK